MKILLGISTEFSFLKVTEIFEVTSAIHIAAIFFVNIYFLRKDWLILLFHFYLCVCVKKILFLLSIIKA